MTQMVSFLIGDSAAVNRTFNPTYVDARGVALFEQTNPVPASAVATPIIGMSTKRSGQVPTRKGVTLNQDNVTTWSIVFPTAEVVGVNPNAPATVKYVESIVTRLVSNDAGVQTSRADLVQLMVNLLNHAQAKDVGVKRQIPTI